MRILALADIHGAYDTMNAIIATEANCDVIVVAGDMTTNGGVLEFGKALKQVQSAGKPVVAVCGNMDPPDLEEVLTDFGISVNGKGIAISDVGFFGVSGAPVSILHTPNEISEEEIGVKAERGWKDVEATRWKVFVPHPPPYKTKVDRLFIGKHVGSRGVKNFIVQRQPDVTICGHIHEARGVDTVERSRIINCGPVGRGHYGIIILGPTISVENRSLS